ncbi:uncharacterized protein LOC143274689 [Babylonia areolata]|uniref:uncharacterized protein LOC143274689 n=1 Tax=Babylonia areolata TaxID=304850 RepID=UPI003FCF2600
MASCLPHRYRHDSENKSRVEKLVQTIRSKRIKLLALDFDLTFIDIHTHGTWEDTLDALIQHVRPCMRDLLQHAQQKGVYVCIVTFHPMSWLIRDLLRKIYPKKVADNIYLQAAPAHRSRRENPGGEFTGKEWHLQKVVAEILKDHKVTIDKQDILLLDDDLTNVSMACSHGHHSMQVQVKEKVIDYSTLESFERMLRIAG